MVTKRRLHLTTLHRYPIEHNSSDLEWLTRLHRQTSIAENGHPTLLRKQLR